MTACFAKQWWTTNKLLTSLPVISSKDGYPVNSQPASVSTIYICKMTTP